MSIEVLNISKRFGGFTALNDVSLEIKSGELMVLLGPSGSGKTTLLRVIAGLEAPDSGSVLIQGDDATDRHVRERRVGFVFQHYALFRHMTVYENVAFGLRVRPRQFRPREQEIRLRVLELLKLVQLEQLANRFPSQLSGGQRQRVALARALAVEPRVLLLDEPFGALDAKVRKELRRWLRGLHDQMRITSVFVTHDQEEALEVADRVVVMNNGQIEQLGTPQEVYESPVTSFVYEFLGNVNLFHGRVDKGSVQFGDLSVEAPEYEDARNAGAIGYVRPHDIEIEPVAEQPEPVIAAAPTPPPSGWKRIRKRLKAVFPFRRFKTLTRTEPEDAAQVPRQPVAIPGTIRVTLSRSSGIGPMVRLELNRTDNGETIEAEISRERYRQLELHVGQHLDIRLKNVKVFLTPTGLNAPDGKESGESSAA